MPRPNNRNPKQRRYDAVTRTNGEEHIIIGRNSVAVALRAGKVRQLYVADGGDARLQELAEEAEHLGIPVTKTDRRAMDARAQSSSHQGLLAIAEKPLIGTREMLCRALRDQERYLIVALDGVTDPHNTGAILRAAECFGVSGVVWSKNRSSGITPAVTKVAVGATAIVPLFEVSNLADTLLELQRECDAEIVCADAGLDALPLMQMTPPDKAVLVLGSEGQGVSDLILRRSSIRVSIPMRGAIDSLNVSQAAAVMLYALCSTGQTLGVDSNATSR